MEKNDPSNREARIRDLTPPKSASASLILNGAGNGMMLGSIPLLITEVINKKQVPKTVTKASGFAVVAGAVIGAVYGAKEARDLKNYREALKNEVADLRAQGDVNTARINSWTEKEAVRPTIANEPSR